MTAPPWGSAAVRTHLVDALHADLVGPFDGDPSSAEVLSRPPSRFYLTGFLAPSGDRDPGNPTDDDEFGEGNDSDDEEQSDAAPEPKMRKLFPASIGLSVLLPPGDARDSVELYLHYADYENTPAEEPSEGRKRPPEQWRRVAILPPRLVVALDPVALARPTEIAGTDGLWMEGKLTVVDAPGLAPGTRALSFFVINHRTPVAPPGSPDSAYVFQVALELRFARGLVARPNRRDEPSEDLDDRIADLQYRDAVEWAVGHGISAEPVRDTSGRVVGARTCWLPRAEVRPIESHEIDGVVTTMAELAAMPDGAALRTALAPLGDAYAAWIAAERTAPLDSPRRAATRDQLMDDATRARERIAEGLDLLATRPELFRAFVLANRAMDLQARKRDPRRYESSAPRWRLFQLAFVLINVAGLDDPRHADRERVELIFFPTGGGKTEAYLGVIAFALVLRRLRGATRPDGGYGVAVLLRYTLRLLTLDQLQRAATMICALETMRREDPATLGEVRFSVGLWVGRTATANTLAEVATKITTWKQHRDNDKAPSPLPLTQCPWCATKLDADTVTLFPNASAPTHVRILCKNFRGCDFGQGNKRHSEEGIPLVFVDEQVYRELPSFLVATVDKFAMVPWRAEAGMLFGRVHSRVGGRFFGTPDTAIAERTAALLPDGLLPPELHRAGRAAPHQRSAGDDGGPLRDGHRSALRDDTLRWDQGAPEDPRLDGHGAPRPPPGALALRPRRGEPLSAARSQRGGDLLRARRPRHRRTPLPGRGGRWSPAEGRAPAGLRGAALGRAEAGRGARAPRRPGGPLLDGGGLLQRPARARRDAPTGGGRGALPLRPHRRAPALRGEGRAPMVSLARAGRAGGAHLEREHPRHRRTRARLARTVAHDEHVDVLLASNMISVGVDIDRLGLMVVAGQPKTASEYIQATSRVGRDAKRPGLVVTVLNLHKARDRSRYERYSAWHDCYYRHVEAMSLTPFSAPALDRGFAGSLLAMARHLGPALQPSDGVMDVEAERAVVDQAIEALAQRAGRERIGLDARAHEAMVETLRHQGRSLLDAWISLVRASREGAGARCWSPFDRGHQGKPLLFSALEKEPPPKGSDDARFAAPTSMRDVEATTHIWVERRPLSRKAVES
jgi:hypothetical protein